MKIFFEHCPRWLLIVITIILPLLFIAIMTISYFENRKVIIGVYEFGFEDKNQKEYFALLEKYKLLKQKHNALLNKTKLQAETPCEAEIAKHNDELVLKKQCLIEKKQLKANFENMQNQLWAQIVNHKKNEISYQKKNNKLKKQLEELEQERSKVAKKKDVIVSELQANKESCTGCNWVDYSPVIDNNGVAWLKKGSKKQKIWNIDDDWAYGCTPLLNDPISFASTLFEHKKYCNFRIPIKDLNSGSLTTIDFTNFHKVKNLKWINETMMQVYLEPITFKESYISEHKITEKGTYNLKLDNTATLITVKKL